MKDAPRILYCVLNWGLGHATRSIPLISKLREFGFDIEIASDGGPLKLLQKTFPDVVTHELPGYDIQYPTKYLFVNAVTQMRKMFSAVPAERRLIGEIVSRGHFDAIISDNRYGCHHADIPSILITHQMRNLTYSRLLQKPSEWIVDQFFKHFDEIWVPDTPDHALSGKATVMHSGKVRFIGWLSDQWPQQIAQSIHVAAILSGPEPQRSYLEEEIRPQLAAYPGNCVLVRGVIEEGPAIVEGNLQVENYRDRQGIGQLLNSAQAIVCRTGYSSLMDLMQVGARALLIPTPGQPEQIYLGEQLKQHPQFVVQEQGNIHLQDGITTLLMQSFTPHRVDHSSLMTDAIMHLREALPAGAEMA